LNLSKSGASPSLRTKFGSIGAKGFSIRTGIKGLYIRQSWGKGTDGAIIGMMMMLIIGVIKLFIFFIIATIKISFFVGWFFLSVSYNLFMWIILTTYDLLKYIASKNSSNTMKR